MAPVSWHALQLAFRICCACAQVAAQLGLGKFDGSQTVSGSSGGAAASGLVVELRTPSPQPDTSSAHTPRAALTTTVDRIVLVMSRKPGSAVARAAFRLIRASKCARQPYPRRRQ